MELKYLHVSELFGSPCEEKKIAELAEKLSSLCAISERVGEILLIKDREKRAESLAGLYLLSIMTDLSPVDLKLTRQSLGKPMLSGVNGVDFNISHSDGFVVCAVDLIPIGIDVERVREIKNRDKLAERYFDCREAEAAKTSDLTFLRLWTRKEAALKLYGDGLTKDLKDISSVEPTLFFEEREIKRGNEKYIISICQKRLLKKTEFVCF